MTDNNKKFLEETRAKLKAKAQEGFSKICAYLEDAFIHHPEATGETYFQHMWFTIRMGLRFLYVSFVIMIHGLFPFLFTTTASKQIELVYRIMKSRIPKKRLEEIDNEKVFSITNNIIRSGGAKVAIIGGGWGGTMVLANLIRKSKHHGNFSIEWFEKENDIGKGIAYSTTNINHLLNVRAIRMGAYADRPEDFFEWLQSVEGESIVAKLCPGHDINSESYVPRMVYSEYIKHVLEKTLAEAKEKNIEINIHHLAVHDASIYNEGTKQIAVHTDEKNFVVDAVVLATGNLPPRGFNFQAGLIDNDYNYVVNVWNPPSDCIFPNKVSELSADSEIVIIGTGLTMVDTVISLKSNGYKGTITAISRNGFIPAAHTNYTHYKDWEWTTNPDAAPKTALGLFSGLRKEAARAEAEGEDWRHVLDSIRPVTQTLWKNLSIPEKRRFTKRLLTIWNIHRHRMAASIHTQLKEMERSGSLKIISGRIYYVGSDKDGLTVAYRKRGENRVSTIRSELILNCTGPEYDIAASTHKLLKNLRDRELITIGPLRIGVETTSSGGAKGKASSSIFPLGTLLIGELLECTAVPELREQANLAAYRVLDHLSYLYDKDYAANLGENI